MIKLRFSLLLLLAIGLMTCASQSKQKQDGYAKTGMESSVVEVDAAETSMDLVTYLRRIPGVQIQGRGVNATVRVRGDVSAQSNTSPLFVVNGTPFGQDFGKLMATVDANDIKSVRVLKSVSDTNRYGMQGASGVIEIKMK